MTERSDGETDARIQAAKVIAGRLSSFLRELSKSPDQREESSMCMGRPEIECRTTLPKEGIKIKYLTTFCNEQQNPPVKELFNVCTHP